MARNASELTLAIRGLLNETNGTITHSEARSKLAAMGFKLAEEPQTISEDLKLWEAKIKEYNKPKDAAQERGLFEAVAKELKFTPSQVRAVLNEAEIRHGYKRQQNNFDVVKQQWQLHHKTRGVGRKPKTAPTKVGRSVPPPPPQKTSGKPGRKSAAERYEQSLRCLQQIEAAGGMAKVQKDIADLEAKAAELSARSEEMKGWLEGVQLLKSKLAEAA